MFAALFLEFFVALHGGEEVAHVVDEAFAVCEAAEEEGLATVGTLWFALFDPGAETVLAGEFAAGGAHSGFLDGLEADVALDKGGLLAAAHSHALHSIVIITDAPFQKAKLWQNALIDYYGLS